MSDSATTTKLQLTILAEMFAGLGHEVSDHRIAYYARLLSRVPPDILRAACDRAVLNAPNGFPPGPGEIMQSAEAIRDERVKAERKAWADEQWAKVIEARSARRITSEAE